MSNQHHQETPEPAPNQPATEDYRHLIESFAQAVWETDAAGQIVQDSPSWRAYTGQTLEQWLGEGWLSAIHPDDRAYALHQWQRAVQDQTPVDAEFRFQIADGGWCWTAVRATALRNPDGSIRKWIGMNIDITEKKRTEEALAQSEERFRAFVTASSDAVYQMSADWREMHQLEGKSFLPDTSTISTSWLEQYIPPQDQDRVQTVIEGSIAAKKPFELAHRVIRADGSLGWTFSRAIPMLNEQGEITEWLGTASDITDRKRAEDALHQQQETYRIELEQQVAQRTAELAQQAHFIQTVTELMPDTVTVLEYPSRNIIYSNRDALVALGFDADEITSMSFAERVSLVHPDDVAGITAFYDQFLSLPDQELARIDYRLKNKKGDWLTISLRGKVFQRDTERQPVRALLIAQDSTERKKAEQEVLQLKDELVQRASNRYTALFNSIDQGFCTIGVKYDEKDEPIDYQFLEVSHSFEHQTGIQNGTGRWMRQIAADQDAYWFEVYGRVAKDRKEERFEYGSTPLGRWWSVYAFPIDEPGLRRIGILFNDITARKQAEANLVFLAEVSQGLARLTNVDQTMDALSKKIAAYLGLSACVFAELKEQAQIGVINYGWHRSDMPSLLGTYRMDEFVTPEVLRLCQAGEAVVIRDVFNDPRTDGEQYAALTIGSFVSMPLVRDGEWRFLSVVYRSEPHDWREDEIELLRELATRIWMRLERARAEEALQRSERRLRLALEATELGTWEWNLTNDEVYWNEQHFRLFGMEYQPQPISPDDFLRHVHPAERDRIKSLLERAIAQRSVYDAEFCAVLEDGSTRWMSGYGRVVEEVDGKPVRMSGVMFDITERRQAGEALHQSEARQRAILKSAKDYAIFTTDLARRVNSWNIGAQAVFGYSEEQIMHQSADLLFTPEDRRQGAPQHEVQKATSEGEVQNERWHSRQDGSRFYGSDVVTPLRDEAGSLIGLLKVMRDLTTQKRAEEALHEADRRKDEFLAMLAHELRNPMATVRNGLTILRLTGGADGMTEQTVAMMNRQVDHLVRMVDDLLDVSRISRGKIELKYERIELGALVASAVDAIRPQYEARQKGLNLTSSSAALFLNGDATRLSQVVANLLTNGLRYTGEQGQVWATLQADNGEAVLRVADNGIGLSADQRTAIFELFVQVDNSLARSQGGLGIGLTLVKRIVEMHGGRVEAHSPGLSQGSEFVIYLPLLEEPNQEKTMTTTTTPNPVSQRILVIDDNADAVLTLSMILKLKGFEVHSRTSGRAGIQAAQELRPTVIICDIGMPELDGYQTCRLIRQEVWGRQMLLVALTGYGQEEDKQHAKEAGFDGHLVKPVDLEVLMSLLTTLIAAVGTTSGSD